MEVVSSRQNPTVKHVVKLLTSGKYRHKHSLAAAEGTHLGLAIWQSGRVPTQLIVAESAQRNVEVASILDLAISTVVEVVLIKDSLFASISDVSADVGIISIIATPQPVELPSLNTDAILLEDVQDPGNVGTILRTAAAAGVEKVYLSPSCASAWSPKALRAGMGAQLSLDIYEGCSLGAVIRRSSVKVRATSLQATASLYEEDLREPSAWLFGNEGQGISARLEQLVDGKVIIPQAETAVESLNVAASVAVCLYEQRRQRI